VAAFFDDLETAVGDCARIELLRTADTAASTSTVEGESDALPAKQEAALRAAVEHGYYESPRDVDVSELAEHLDVPRSTLTYRLRRAEEHLAKQYVDREQPAEALSTAF
jgi:predicted DNA binding protein